LFRILPSQPTVILYWHNRRARLIFGSNCSNCGIHLKMYNTPLFLKICS
jgi:hypothetical protein